MKQMGVFIFFLGIFFLAPNHGLSYQEDQQTVEALLESLTPDQVDEVRKRTGSLTEQAHADYEAITRDFVKLQTRRAYLRQDIAIEEKKYKEAGSDVEKAAIEERKRQLELRKNDLDLLREQNRNDLLTMREDYSEKLRQEVKKFMEELEEEKKKKA